MPATRDDIATDKILPRGLDGLKCLAVASVYATHMHYVILWMRTQAASSVSHFFFYSGLLAYHSLRGPFSQMSLFQDQTKGYHSLVRFLTRDLWITWIVFILKRCLIIFIYFQVWHFLVVVHSPSYFPSIWYPELRLFTHFWAHWWSHPTGTQIAGSPHLWFMSPVSLFWVLSPPVVAILYPLPDHVILLLTAAMAGFSLYFINLMPPLKADWTTYYFSPQTHWPAYALGLLLWRARDCASVKRVFNSQWLYKRNIWTRFIFPLAVDAMCCVFAWWSRHVLIYRTRPGDDFTDPLFRTNVFLAAIVFIWSTPLADHSLGLKFASARYWDLVAPGSVKLAMYVTQWSLGYIIIPHMRDLTGRVLCLLVTYYASLLSESMVLCPLRELLTPWYDRLQQYASATKTLKAKRSTMLIESKSLSNIIP